MIVLGFAGTREELEWQLAKAAELGFTEQSSLDYAKAASGSASSFQTISVLPSKMIETLRALGPAPFIARAGNGIVYHRANVATPPPNLPTHWLCRVKDTFDPKHILPELPA